MTILEQSNFIKSIHPFENLTKVQLEEFSNALDIVYIKKDEIIQKQGSEPEYLYFIIKGLVQEKVNDEVLSIHSKGEFFDTISLIENYSKHSFIAAQESICYVLPRKIFKYISYFKFFLKFFKNSSGEKIGFKYRLNKFLSSLEHKDLYAHVLWREIFTLKEKKKYHK